MEKEREFWVDDVKVIACILVVLGHFFQSMIKADILPSNDLYKWFDQTIYYFHVPLFFICSGYLYQRFSKVDSASSWMRSVLKKALTLGVPYFTFSFATWLLKTLFADSTNSQVNGLSDAFFIHPISSYWYLYALFFIFLITPTFKSVKMAEIGFIIALTGKVFTLVCGGGYSIYAVSIILANEIWFIGGMCLAVNKWKVVKAQIGFLLGGFFIALSIVVYTTGVKNRIISFLLGIVACTAIIIMVVNAANECGKQNRVLAFFAKYTMPIFVMHTLFAAPFRALLLKVGINNAVVHVTVGIAISFTGPIIAAEIMKKTKVLEFFLYPNKFVKM